MPTAKRALVTGLALGCLAAAAACASILGIPDRSLEWCLQPANAHPFCEDFDHQNPTEQWSTAPPPVSGASRTFVPSSFSFADPSFVTHDYIGLYSDTGDDPDGGGVARWLVWCVRSISTIDPKGNVTVNFPAAY
jgi:hypothetical protein